jgi:NAD+ synthase (glutamine-hydrolysing)
MLDVEVVDAVVDLAEVWSFRTSPAHGIQSLSAPSYQRYPAQIALSSSDSSFDPDLIPNPPRELKLHSPEAEIAHGPALWMWDYCRRSGASGFFIPLSGGLDSCSTATLVYSMCREVLKALHAGNKQVEKDCMRIVKFIPKTPQELCNKLLSTAYLGMASQSSPETRDRARRLAKDIGANHCEADIDRIFDAFRQVFADATGFTPSFESTLDSKKTEDLALQNIQARSRMVLSYFLAQLLPSVNQGSGGLLVLGSSNVDECLRGYLVSILILIRMNDG